MSWIPPFEMQTWIVNVLSGNPEIFFALSLMVVIGMAAYFKMTQLTMFFLLGLFILMFKDYIPQSITTLAIIIAAVAVGFVAHKIYNRT